MILPGTETERPKEQWRWPEFSKLPQPCRPMPQT
jgi:hypothetical protein